MRIYNIAATATTAASGDKLIIDSGAGSEVKQITYANFCLNQPAISTASLTATTGSSTYFSAATGVLSALSVTGATAPTAATDTGTVGEIRFPATTAATGYLYVCVGTNVWKRAELNSW